MDETIKKELEKEEMSPFHQRMLDDSKQLVNMSRQKMSGYYQQWDDNHDIYRGVKKTSVSDVKAQERDEPVKMIVPASYAQVQTFISFCFQIFTQRDRLFELIGVSPDDHEAAKVAEAFLARDLEKNVFQVILYKVAKCIGVFGLGIIKSCWVRETQRVGYTSPSATANGQSSFSTQTALKYLGNKLTDVSPYVFFPDTRLPVGRFQEGEFVASEEVVTYAQLRQWEADGVVAGIKHVRDMDNGMLHSRGESRVYGMNENGQKVNGPASLKSACVLTEVQRVIVPSDYMVDDKPIGPETYPIKYVIWYVNDNRVIKCEPLGYLHDQFTYDVAEYDPDLHNLVNDSLLQVMSYLQEALTWFINARITNVRKVIGNKLIVDPSGIIMSDLENRNPVIRLQAGAARQGVDKFVKQLDMQDVTTNHVGDADMLFQWIQVATGINDNALGQFHTGRRSAQEARTVATAAAARLKMVASLIFLTCFQPLARKMLSNLRDGLDEMQVVRLLGLEQATRGASFIKADKTMLAGEYDFEIFDGTLPSERLNTATYLGELVMGLMTNPQAALALQMDPREILRESMQLRGIRNPERFALAVPPQPPQQPGMPGAPGQDPNAQPPTDNGFDQLIEG